MKNDSTTKASLEAENLLLRETLTWIVKNSLDAAARARARETLRQLGASAEAGTSADRSDPEIDGEWCI